MRPHHHRDFHDRRRITVKGFGFLAVIVGILNFALWGGLIYVAFWCASHFGLIG